MRRDMTVLVAPTSSCDVGPAAAARGHERPQGHEIGMKAAADFPIGGPVPPVRPDERLFVAALVAEQANAAGEHLNTTYENAARVDAFRAIAFGAARAVAFKAIAYPNGHSLFEVVQAANLEVLDVGQLSGTELRLHGRVRHPHEGEGTLKERDGEAMTAPCGAALSRFVGRLKAGKHGKRLGGVRRSEEQRSETTTQ